VGSKDKILSLAAHQRPMSTDAVFWIASMSKAIAATALMMLCASTIRWRDIYRGLLLDHAGECRPQVGGTVNVHANGMLTALTPG
jgi:hypothetical protein